MAADIGKSIEGQPSLPEGDGRFKQALDVLLQPENLMPAIILGASLLQGKRHGESGGAAAARSLVGALGTRNFMLNSAEDRRMKQEEQASVQRDRLASQDARQEQLRLQREGMIQQSADAAAGRDVQRQNIAAQAAAAKDRNDIYALMNAADNETRMAIARMQAELTNNPNVDPTELIMKLVSEEQLAYMNAGLPYDVKAAFQSKMRWFAALKNPALLSDANFELGPFPGSPAPGGNPQNAAPKPKPSGGGTGTWETPPTPLITTPDIAGPEPWTGGRQLGQLLQDLAAGKYSGLDDEYWERYNTGLAQRNQGQ